MRAVVIIALVAFGFLLGRIPMKPNAPSLAVTPPTTGGVSVLDLVDDSPATAPTITQQAAEALRRNEGGSAARNLHTLSEEPGAAPGLRTLAEKAEAVGKAQSEAEAGRLSPPAPGQPR